MEYKGKLYGKVANKYFPLESTTEEWDNLEKKIKHLEMQVKSLQQETSSLAAARSKEILQFIGD